MKPALKVRHLVVRLAARESERHFKENQTVWSPATIWTKLAVILSAQTGVPADNIRPESRWEELVPSTQIRVPAETDPSRVVEPEHKKRYWLWTVLIFLARVLGILLRIVFYPIVFLAWLSTELSGEGPRRRQLTKMFQERAPLPGAAFLDLCACSMEEAAIWLAIRQVVASCCKLPETAIYPYDDLSSLEWMMADPGPDARWYQLGCSWLDVIFQLEERLGVRISSEKLEERLWKVRSKGDNLNGLATLLTEVIRGRLRLSR
jgi:hypothetical protein